MKKGIHPENYRLVAFKDMSNDHVFLCRSAVSTKETIEVNGETYPVYKMEISNTRPIIRSGPKQDKRTFTEKIWGFAAQTLLL